MEIVYRTSYDELCTLIKEDLRDLYCLELGTDISITDHYEMTGGFDSCAVSFTKEGTLYERHYTKVQISQLSIAYLLTEEYILHLSHVAYHFTLSPQIHSSPVASPTLEYLEVTIKEPLHVYHSSSL